METTITLPDMKGQKVTILKEGEGGFYYTMEVIITDQGINPYFPNGNTPFFTYTIGRKKKMLVCSVTPDMNIALFNGHIVIDTEHQYIDDENENVGCFNPINFDRSLQSTNQQPIFINRKKED